MSDRIAQLYVELSARTEKLEASLKSSQAGLNKFKGGLKDVIQGLTGFDVATFGTVAAVGALAAGLKFSIAQAMEAEAAMAQTESVIKATGGAAGLTADQIADMAGDLSYMTGIADDVIQSGQNMLLTFKNIKGETFERTTRAMNDMAVAMNGGNLEGIDLKNTAIQLGKALNDPIKGLSALSRVGVTFTEEQKELIKTMVEMGDVAGAQAVILSELESEFGGAAEAAGNTTAGQFAKLKNELGELGEEIGTVLIPALSAGATATTGFLKYWREGLGAVREGRISLLEYYTTAYEVAFTQKTVAEATAEFSEELKTEETQIQATNHWLLTLGNSTEGLDVATGQSGKALDAYAARWQGLAEHIQAVEKAQRDAALVAPLAAGLAGDLTHAQDAYRAVLAETQPEIDKLTADIRRMNAAHGQTFTVVREAEHSIEEYELAQLKAATAAQKLNEFTGDSREEYLELKIAADNAAAGVARMGEEMGISETFTADYTKKLMEANGELSELEAQQLAAEEAMKRATAQFLYQQIAADLDREAALSLARELGLLSEADYIAATAAQTAAQAYDGTKESIEKLTDATGILRDTINALQDKNISITISTFYKEYYEQIGVRPEHEGDTGAGGEGAYGGGTGTNETENDRDNRAFGGRVMGGWSYNWNEPGAEGEILVPAGNGYVLNRHDAMAAVAGRGGDDGAVAAALAEISAVLQALPANIGRSVRDSVQKAMA